MLITLATHAQPIGRSAHRVVSLKQPDAGSLALARAAGLEVVCLSDPEELELEVAAADIAQFHFWNTPELYDAMRACRRASRVVVWCHVAGDSAPHVMSPALVEWADVTVASCTYSQCLPIFQDTNSPEGARRTAAIHAATDFDRLARIRPRPHDGFAIGYIGSVDFSKMEPRFVALAADVRLPDARFVVCGSGDAFHTLAGQASARGIAGRFEWLGYVEDVASVIERLDVFGYPLREGTYAASELVLQEAMYAGVPPVIFRRGGPQAVVTHNETGLVVDDEAGYVRALEYLYHHPVERRRLGAAAARYARETFSAARMTGEFDRLYESLMERAKRVHEWPSRRTPTSGAERFVESLGNQSHAFDVSLSSRDIDRLLDAEAAIATSPPPLVDPASGGILHYRAHDPADPHLRLWAGLALLGQQRPALAAGEFRAAIDLGCRHWRASWYLARAAVDAGAIDLARESLEDVVNAAPEFQPARDMLASCS